MKRIFFSVLVFLMACLSLMAQRPPPIYHGSFIGDGSGLTNVNPSNPNLGLFFVTNGSSAAQISAAVGIVSNVIQFAPGDYYNIVPMTPASNVTIYGNGAVLHMLPGATGFIFDCSTNIPKFCVENLVFSGDDFTPRNNTTFITNFSAAYPYLYTPWYIGNVAQGQWTNRNAIRINVTGGGHVQNCAAYGFSGYGFVFVANNGLLVPGPTNLMSFFIGNQAISNYCGAAAWGFAYDWNAPGVTSNPQNLTMPEYTIVQGNHFNQNGIGFYNSCGNISIVGNDITGNGIGFYSFAGDNPGHGEFNANTVTHNNIHDVVIESTTDITITANQFLSSEAAAGSLVIDGANYVNFTDNDISPSAGGILVTNSHTNVMNAIRITDNYYDGSWTTIGQGFNLGPGGFGGGGGGSIILGGNCSKTIVGDNDGSLSSLLLNGNQGTAYDTVFGTNTGYRGLSGCFGNTMIGTGVMNSIVNNSYQNTAIGFDALTSLQVGAYNTALGASLVNMTTGNGNIAVGFQAGQNNVSGSFNTYLGPYQAGTNGESGQQYLGGPNTVQTFIFGTLQAIGLVNFNAGATGTIGCIASNFWSYGTNVAWNVFNGSVSNLSYVAPDSGAWTFQSSGTNNLKLRSNKNGYGLQWESETNTGTVLAPTWTVNASLDTGGSLYVNGIGSTANSVNTGFSLGVNGCTNTSKLVEMFDITASSAAFGIFNSNAVRWSTNTATTSSRFPIILQAGGWFTNSGTWVLNGETAF